MPDQMTNHDHPVQLDRTEARQGRRGRPVLYVLVGGLALALIAWAIVEFAVK